MNEREREQRYVISRTELTGSARSERKSGASVASTAWLLSSAAKSGSCRLSSRRSHQVRDSSSCVTSSGSFYAGDRGSEARVLWRLLRAAPERKSARAWPCS